MLILDRCGDLCERLNVIGSRPSQPEPQKKAEAEDADGADGNDGSVRDAVTSSFLTHLQPMQLQRLSLNAAKPSIYNAELGFNVLSA